MTALIYAFLFCYGIIEIFSASLPNYDCSKPPVFVDPHACCVDPPPNSVAQQCANMYGLPLASDSQVSTQPPTIEATVCFADCVLTQSKYIVNGNFDYESMRNDIQQQYSNDTSYSSVMISAFKKCATSAKQKLEQMKLIPNVQGIINGKCNPYAGIVLGCSYTEFFKNCPANRWIGNSQCDTARIYVQNCVD